MSYLFFFTDSKLDIVFIVTNCRNNPSDSLNQQLHFARDSYQSLPMAAQNKRIAIISVANGAEVVQGLTSSPTNFSAVLPAYTPPMDLCTVGQGLATASAIFKANSIKGVTQVLVALLAGKSGDDVSKFSKDLQQAGVLVYIVGLTNLPDKSSVIEMASDPASEYFISSPGFPTSGSTKQALLEKLDSGMSKIILCLF